MFNNMRLTFQGNRFTVGMSTSLVDVGQLVRRGETIDPIMIQGTIGVILENIGLTPPTHWPRTSQGIARESNSGARAFSGEGDEDRTNDNEAAAARFGVQEECSRRGSNQRMGLGSG